MDYWEKQNSKKMVHHWVEWITDLLQQQGDGYFCTFMFHNIPGKASTQIELMFKDVDKVYLKLLTRAVKNTRSVLHEHKRPLLIVSPDLPIFKYNKPSIQDVTINDGRHLHGFLINRPGHCFKNALQYEMKQNDHIYRSNTAIRAIHVEPINRTPEVVARYGLKAIGFHFDDTNIRIWPGPPPIEKKKKLIDHYLG